MEAIISSLITSGLTLVGVILTINSGQKKTESKLETGLAVTDTKLAELTREVREHNGFAREIPLLKQSIADQKQDIEKLEKEIKELEKRITKMGGV